MASSYPGGLDSFGTPAPTDSQSVPVGGRTHSQSHGDLGDAVEAIEAELGLAPSGAAATVVARLDSLDATVGGKEASGTAASAVSTHAALTTPHIPAGAVSGSGAIGAVKWDESVGRRCFVWDTVNSRWQMVYGDTGWRNITSTATGGVPGSAMVRRVGYTVTVRVYNVPAGVLIPMVAGFRPYESGSGVNYPAGVINAATPALFSWTGGASFTPQGGAISYAGSYLEWSYTAGDPWPTALPGTASGAIPYN